MMFQVFCRVLFLLVSAPLLASGFVCVPQPQHAAHVSLSSALYAKKTLTDETTWRLRFVLNGIPTEKGKRVDELFAVDVNFIEEAGYEPPQGSLRQILPEEESGNRILKVEKSRWELSEDPNDRKDGLWIWGLFSDPLHPFLLLSIETSKIPVPGPDDDFIKPLQLFAQINHKRDADEGVILSSAELKVREIETIKADPFGAATVDVYEEISIGRINIQVL